LPQPIKHLVVLMLENRSFDHMLGFLPQNATDPINILTGHEKNPVDVEETAFVPVSRDARTVADLEEDPKHELPNVTFQIFSTDTSASPTPNMNGFVIDYGRIAGNSPNASKIMNCFTPDTLPVLSTLAQHYGVCDRWFSSVPGPTIPNRLFTHAAHSNGSADQDALGAVFKIRTIFEEMDVKPNASNNYRIYTHGASILMSNEFLQVKKQDRFSDFIADFESDASKGDIPEYTFIEPAYGDDPNNNRFANSQHPDFAVDEGEALIATVYNALRNGKNWKNTLLLITYDEHGGIFDHVPPPKVAPSAANSGLPDVPPSINPAFDFRRLGVRVPAVFVSPRIAPNTVISDSDYEHCSIVATVRKLFCGVNAQEPFNWREAQAPTFENILTLDDANLNPDIKLPPPFISAGPTPANHSASELMVYMARNLNNSLEQRGITPPSDVNAIQSAEDAVAFFATANAAAIAGGN
jgi:phospholipase C